MLFFIKQQETGCNKSDDFVSLPKKMNDKKFDYALLNEVNSQLKTAIRNDKKIICVTSIETGIGEMVAGATDKGLCMLEFADSKKMVSELKQLGTLLKAALVKQDNSHIILLRQQLEEYFKGERREFTVPLDLAGTDFQVKAWLGLLNIPYGCTTSYAKQAESLGRPTAVRAVANANARNRISIVLPCHRVIGTNGSLTGYGGEIWRKKRLLELERNALEK